MRFLPGFPDSSIFFHILQKIAKIEVQCAANPAFKKKLISKKTGKKKTSLVLTLARKKTYYLRVRYQAKDGGVSKWSTVKKVTTN